MKMSKIAFAAMLAFAAAASQAQSVPPNDAQIAAIVVTANQVDIDAGKLAESSAMSKDVKAFAKQMVTDHGAVNKAASELVGKLKATPQENDTSKSLKSGGDDNLAKLKKLKGAEFDRAYVDQEVSYQQAVLDALDKSLIPNAKNEELKALLQKSRPTFVAHLEHAKQIQSSLGKRGG